MTEHIEVLTHSSIRIRGGIGTIYVDPFQMKEEPHDADYILITHDHYDHFSVEDIEKAAGGDTILVIPEKMKEKAEQTAGFIKKIYTVQPGNEYDIDGLKLETIPAYNQLKPFHAKSAGWVGYILCLDDRRIYIAGDTDATKETKQVKCDIALVPVGGTYTMDAKKAAELINDIRPIIAIPTHYGSIVGRKEDADIFAENVKEPVKVEIRMA